MPHQRISVLVLEDEAIVALDLDEGLREAGYRVGGPFATCSAARIWLRTAKPDVALLDAFVSDGTSVELARDLNMRGVPIVIFSARNEAELGAAELHGATWIAKPAPIGDVVQAVTDALKKNDPVSIS